MIPKRAVLSAFAIALAPVAAQAQGITRQPLQTTDFPAGFQTVTGIATVAPGACAGLHTHPGLRLPTCWRAKSPSKLTANPTRR